VRRVTIEYADQNDAFARFLPRSGGVVSELSDTSGNAGWLLVDLDETFEYQVKVGEPPFRFMGSTVTHFLVRSRQKGVVADAAGAVPVFILLVEQGLLPQTPIDPKDYIQAAWGTCSVLDGA
jgi:hypothetical protein